MDIKNKKEQNKNIYITIAVILVALAVAVAVTAVVGKKAAEPELEDLLQAGDNTSQEDIGEVANGTQENKDDQMVFEDKTENKTDTEADTEPTVKEEEKKEAESTQTSETEKAPASNEENEEANKTEELPDFSKPVSAGYVINGNSETVPVFSITMNDYRTHFGVDVSAEQGEAVLATADGVIGAIYEDPMMGTCMTVVHSGGAVSTYKGLYSTIPDGIVQGASVTKGQPIAAVGDSALAEIAEESHIHYELAIDGVNVDPCLYIDFDEEIYEN